MCSIYFLVGGRNEVGVGSGGRGGEALVWRVFCLRGLFYHFRGVRNGAGCNENGKPGGVDVPEEVGKKQNYYIFARWLTIEFFRHCLRGRLVVGLII